MFITNHNEACLLKSRLSELMSFSRQLDMLVGFFYYSAVKVLSDPLKANPDLKLRVLVGMEAEKHCGQLVELVLGSDGESNEDIRNRYYTSLRTILGDSTLDNRNFHERLETFIQLLEEKRLEVRKTREPNHAKLYIFSMNDENAPLCEKVWITGSSNFSEPGLSIRDELNVEISDFGAKEASDFFEELWEDAVSLTDDEEQRRTLISILRDSSVAATVTPYEAYFLILKNYLEHQQLKLKMTKLNHLLTNAGFSKLQYQVDAVGQALNKLHAYHGVIIADVVGLGKSVIGSLVGAMSGKRGMIICPPGLVGERSGAHGGWYEYVRRFGLTDWEVFSRGALDKVEEFLAHDSDFDIVIVDEAHYYRNESTDAYARIKNICCNKDVVLLTATPFNNRPADLLALLHLFTSGKESPFVPGGNLDGRFSKFKIDFENINRVRKAIVKEDWAQVYQMLTLYDYPVNEPENDTNHQKARANVKKYAKELSMAIRQVMEKIVIRRNRLDLQNDPDYASELSTLSHLQEPVPQFFELSKQQDAFYDKVIHEYFGPEGRFRGAFYRPQAYMKDQEGLDDYQDNIYNMLLRMLALRFESSFGAFRQSVINAQTMMEKALTFIARYDVFIYDRKATSKLLEIEDDVDAYKALLDFLEEKANTTVNSRRRTHEAEYRINDPGFDGARFINDIKSDISLLKELLDEVDTLKLVQRDPKVQALCDVSRRILSNSDENIEQEATKRKILVFTAYSDTLRHIAPYFEKSFPGRVLTVDSNTYSQEKDRMVKANFDASAEDQRDDYDVLLTTDKLSEGFNLNRAGVVVNYDIPWNPTRVIQRVGRINRIGKKVFENLYILNFFPTVKGSTINQNREMAQSKMFAIHAILGEDAQIFTAEEEPTPAALFSRINSSIDDRESISIYTKIKLKYSAALDFMKKNHPEQLQRIMSLPHYIKTAMPAEPHATLMFRRRGPSFFALRYDAGREISEIPMDEAISLVECEYDTKQVPLSHDFWLYPSELQSGARGSKNRGIYTDLKNYEPVVQPAQRGGVSDSLQAVSVIVQHRESLSYDLKKFADEVMDDIQHYGSIPRATLVQLASAGSAEETAEILKKLRSVRGGDYYTELKRARLDEEVVVTVQRN